MMVTMITGLVSAQYVPSVQGSAISFKIKNFGFDVNGKFTGIQGTINFDPQNPAKGNFDVTVDAGSINTDNSMRDKHLKGESYFDIAEYPNIHFVSTGIEAGTNSEMFILTGKLTIKNTVREIKFPFAATSTGDGYIFKGSFKIKRKDFNVGGTSTISDELEVSLNVQAKKA
jgi:polyisoprenoid-binding protein YceI